MSEFRRRSRIEVPAERLFAWHEAPGAFERLNPPWDPVQVVEAPADIRDGARAAIRLRIGPLPIVWRLVHRDYAPGRSFRDVQTSGPFRRWEHLHLVEPDPASPSGPDAASFLEDRIDFSPPLGALGEPFVPFLVTPRLRALFDYRHRITRDDLTAVARRETPPMKIAVTGATGLVGSALVPFLKTAGHEVVPVVRAGSGAGACAWNPADGTIDAAALEGVDAIVHLAGENIGSGRWSDAKKKRIVESRVAGTSLIARTAAGLKRPPRVLVCASAVGFYGARGDAPDEPALDETAAPGDDFLADVCRQWEAAAEPARAAGIRVAHARFGVILDPRGGALAKMLLPFKMGVGGVVGSGRQWMSWVALDDVLGALEHAIATEGLAGPFNVVAPGAVTNAGFTKALGRALGRPTIFPMPAFAARLAFGEMADALLLTGQRVRPARLEAAGYRFRHPEIEGALRHMLGR